MDPLTDSRASEADLWRDPLTRVRENMEIQEQQEAVRAEAQRQERQWAAEAAAQVAEAQRRAQIWSRGYSDAELQAYEAQREQVRRAKIQELEDQLDRLDPQRRQARQLREQRATSRAADERAAREIEAMRSDPVITRAIEARRSRLSDHERNLIRAAEVQEWERRAREVVR